MHKRTSPGLDEEQARIDAEERDDWNQWARAAESAPPSPRTAEREALARRRELAAADLVAASNGEKGVEARRHELVAELGGVTNALFAVQVSKLAAENREDYAAMCETMKSMIEPNIRFRARMTAFYNVRNRETNAQNMKRVEALTAALAELEPLTVPALPPDDPRELERLTADVQRRLAG